MPGLQILASVLFCILFGSAVGQLPPPDDEFARVIVEGNLLAGSFTDGTTVITGGNITAETAIFTGDLTAGDSTFGTINAADAWLGDVTSDSALLQNLWAESMLSYSSADFQQDLWIGGDLMSGLTTFGPTILEDLTVTNDAVVEGIIFAQENIQVTFDVNVGGNSRFFGDVIANQSVIIEEELRVNEMTTAENFFVANLTSTEDLVVTGYSNIGEFLVNNDTSVDGNFSVAGTLYTMGDFYSEDMVKAYSGNFSQNIMASENMTVIYDISGADAYFGEQLKVVDASIEESLTVGDYLNVIYNLEVQDDVSIQGDISAGDKIMSMYGMFDSLTSVNATATNIYSETTTTEQAKILQATALESMMVMDKLESETLEVISMTETQSAWADNWVSEEVVTDLLDTQNLTITGNSLINDAYVEESLIVGRPSISDNWHAAFESAFADVFKTMNLTAEFGTITNTTSDWVRYDWIDSELGTFNSSMVERAWIDMAMIDEADAERIWADSANYTKIVADNFWFENLTASGNSTIESLYVGNVLMSDNLASEMGYAMWLEAGSISVRDLEAAYGTITTLDSRMGEIMWLNASEATITELRSLYGYIDMVNGDQLSYQWGNITDVLSTNFWTGIYNVSGYTTTNGVFGTRANSTNLWAEDLRVTSSAYLGETLIMEDLMVVGRSYLEGGLLSGEAVVATITVAGTAELSDLVVSTDTFLNDLMVKRVTITETFESEMTRVSQMATTEDLIVSGDVVLGGDLEVVGDTEMGQSLFVRGTTSFQVGSFTTIGTAQLNATSFESFTFRLADATIPDIQSTTLEVGNTLTAMSYLKLGPMFDSTSGANYSFYSSPMPETYQATQGGVTSNYTVTTAFHSGAESIDQLVVTDPTDPTQAVLRVTGDASLDFLDGEMIFGDMVSQGGIVFENEQNVAWATTASSPTTNLVPGLGDDTWYDYSDLIDRDMISPGAFYDPSRFSEPGIGTDLLTLAPGHYTVSGNVYFRFLSATAADSKTVARAGINAFSGIDSSGAQQWSALCYANWMAVAGSTSGGSCYFSNILNVPAGETMTLRTTAEYLHADVAGPNLGIDSRSTLVVTELFERTSQGV